MIEFTFFSPKTEKVHVAYGNIGDASLYERGGRGERGVACRPTHWVGVVPYCHSWVCTHVNQSRATPGTASLAHEDQALKADGGKPRFDLLMDGMANALLDVVKVLTWAVHQPPCAPWPHGGKGYKAHSWKEVPEAKRRYRAAMQRHENAIARGEVNDPESGLPHRAHIATNALFLAELDYLIKE